MTPSILASHALAKWTAKNLAGGERSVSRQELPAMDVPIFFRALSEAGSNGSEISMALVGFGQEVETLEGMARDCGLRFPELAVDLHKAAGWRNNRQSHPTIVAFAHGRVAGVNTLRHFPGPSSEELSKTLLDWAKEQAVFNSIPAQRLLLEALVELCSGDGESRFSYEELRIFLSAWANGGDPRDLLPHLGLFKDPNLFAHALGERLELGLSVMGSLRDRASGAMEALRKRFRTDAPRLEILRKLMAIRRNPNIGNLSAVELDEAVQIFRGKPAAPEENNEEKTEEEEEKKEEEADRPLNDKRLQATCTEALLDNREEELEKNAEALSQALRSAIEDDSGNEDGTWSGDIEVKGESQKVEGKLDRAFVSWIRHFCSETAFGGLIETSTPDLKRALQDYDRPETLIFDTTEILRAQDSWLGMREVLTAWDEDLQDAGFNSPGFVVLWDHFLTLRAGLLGCLDELAHFPLEWFAGKPKAASQAEEYLDAAAKLMGAVGSHFGNMVSIEPTMAKDTLQGLLALDVVQVRVPLEEGRFLSKAVLLPVHPLHLWRYWRLSRILRGLGADLAEEDRTAVVREACEPRQFLGVIYASRLPGGRGAGQVLPVSNELHRLATFENLRNSYNGTDGSETLFYAVQRFASTCRQHVSPLRLALINPPEPGRILVELIKLLDGRKKDFLPRLRVEIFGTSGQKTRLRNALLFDTKVREIIEEKIASGRLELLIHRAPRDLNVLLEELKTKPVHVAAIFDEAPVKVRRGGVGLQLPMSPFCVRRKVQFQKRLNEMRLEVTSGDPPFFQFMELVKSAEGVDGDGTPYAFSEAEALRSAVDGLLASENFGAHWLLLADRALPDESGMKSRRLLRRREGQRQVLLAARDYSPLIRLILPVFETDVPNLLLSPAQFESLLAEGAHLVGAGLLEVVKSQEGSVAPEKVIGLTGAMLAARNYRREHPDALLVSTDSQLARTWLRLGAQGERCDMLALRHHENCLILEAIEVKTAKGAPRVVGDPEIVKAEAQLAATLDAVREGLGDTAAADASGACLAAPRNEMLKEVLVAGCMAKDVPAERRKLWAEWLERIFGVTPETPLLQGLIVDVALGSAERCSRETLATSPTRIDIFHLTELGIEELIDSIPEAASHSEAPPSAQDEDEDSGGSPPTAPTLAEPLPQAPSAASSAAPATVEPPQAVFPIASIPEQTASVLLGVRGGSTEVSWKVHINQNPHLMIVGQPGTGKTTSLVNICRQLGSQGIAPIIFSYHDDIDEKLSAVLPGVVFSDSSNLGFNPMEVRSSDDIGYIDSAGQLRDIFAAIHPDLGGLQLATLYEAFKRTYEANGWIRGTQGNTPRFSEFLQILRSNPRPDRGTRTLINRLTELEDRGFFEADSPKPGYLDSQHPVVLKLHETRSMVAQTAFAAFAFYRIYQDMFRRGRPNKLTHAVLFDEAHRASKLFLIPTMAKECRKYGISLILASQEAADFAPELFAAIDSTLVLRVTDESARQIAKNKVVGDMQRELSDRIKQLPNYEAIAFGSQFGSNGTKIKLAH